MDTPPPIPPASSTPPPVPAAKRGWWSRNWKWFVPVGCLSLFVLFAGFIAAICLFVFTVLKSTDVYKEALVRAKADPAVVQALGEPIKEGLMPFGGAQVNGA